MLLMTKKVQILIYKDYDKDLWRLCQRYGRRWFCAQAKNALSYYVSGNRTRQPIPKKKPDPEKTEKSLNGKSMIRCTFWCFDEDDDITRFLQRMPSQSQSQLIKLIVRHFLYKELIQLYDLPFYHHAKNVEIKNSEQNQIFETKQEESNIEKEKELQKEEQIEKAAKTAETENQEQKEDEQAAMLANLFGGLKF
jgi:hypothetical protein